MAVRKISLMLNKLGVGDVNGLRQNQTANIAAGLGVPPAFVVQGQVEVVRDDGTYEVFYDGLRREATPATDEPILAGMKVWLSQANQVGNSAQGWVIHGTVKG